MSIEFPAATPSNSFEGYPEGLQRDIRILRENILAGESGFLQNGAPSQLRDLVQDSLDLVDTSKKTILLSELVKILLIKIGEEGWNYDEIDFATLREELEVQGFVLRPKKTAKDYN